MAIAQRSLGRQGLTVSKIGLGRIGMSKGVAAGDRYPEAAMQAVNR